MRIADPELTVWAHRCAGRARSRPQPWHPEAVTDEAPRPREPDPDDRYSDNRDPSDDWDPSGNSDPDDDWDPDAWDPDAPDPREKREAEDLHNAWGSWRPDRAANRRKTLRALVGLVVVSVTAGLFAYGCDLLRGPPQVRLNTEVGGYVLQPPTAETESLRGRFEASGAIGPAAAYYRGPTDVLFLAGFGTELPTDVVDELLPPGIGADAEFDGRGGPLVCGPTIGGSRCLWKSGDVVGGTSGAGLPPDQLERITRDLRAGALRP